MIATTSNFTTWVNSYTGGKIVFALEIDGYSRVFTNAVGTGATGEFPYLKIEDSDDLTLSLSDLEGGADQQSFQLTVQDHLNLITADFPGTTFEGKFVTLKMGSLSLAYADYAEIFIGLIDTVASANGNTDYQFNLVDLTQLLQKPIYTTADNGLPTSSSNLKTIIGHPLAILSDIVLNKLGIDPSRFDSATVDAYMNGIFDGFSFKYELDQGPNALDFIQKQILKPLGGYVWSGGSGKIGVHFFYPLAAPVSVMDIDATVLMGVPLAEQTDLINTVQYQFDKASDGGGGYQSNVTEEYGPSVSLYGQVGEAVIAADGMRSGFQGFYLAKLISHMIFLRYGFKNLKFDQNTVPSLLKTVLLEPGDIVSVSHRLIPDRKNGVMGIVSKLFEIIGKQHSLGEGVAMLSMIDADYLSSFGSFKIAPDGHANFAASSSGDKAKYMFMTNDSDQYSTGADGNVLG